jgi:hypothetical protein
VDEAPAPARPDEAGNQRRIERRWFPVLAILGVVAVVTVGGRSVAAALADAAAPAVAVGPAVTIHPPSGWTVEAAASDGDESSVMLSRGTAVLRVTAVAAAIVRSPDEILVGYLEENAGGAFADRSVGEPESGTVDGAPAVKVGYVGSTTDGVGVEGAIVAAAAPSATEVVFDAAAPAGDLASAADDIVAMIRGAELR